MLPGETLLDFREDPIIVPITLAGTEDINIIASKSNYSI